MDLLTAGLVAALLFLTGYFLVLYTRADDARMEAEAKLLEKERALAEAKMALTGLKEEQEDKNIDYSIMAGMIEEHTTEFADVHKHMDETDKHMQEHCRQIDQIVQMLSPHMVHLTLAQVPWAQENADGYEYDPDEEPYAESTCPEATPLPEYMNKVAIEGLDELKGLGNV